MIEVVVLLSIIVTTIFLTGLTAAFGSENKHSGRKDYYGGSISSRSAKKESK
jgi:hypothetical protein